MKLNDENKVEERAQPKLRNQYSSEADENKQKSKIPRLNKGSVDQDVNIKLNQSALEYNNSKMITPQKPPQLRKSQSFLQNLNSNSSKKGENNDDIKVKVSDKNLNSANKILPAANNLENNRSSSYKPYTLREYKEKINYDQPFISKQRGGLGADIGGEEWQKEHEKRMRIKNFSSRIKNKNMSIYSDGMRRTSQTSNSEFSEK